MEVVLRGVRGSIANPSADTLFYGGHTTCIELLTNDGTFFVFDAGTGLFQLNNHLPPVRECHIFLSHAHADHIQGLSFFKPLHDHSWTVHIYASAGVRATLEEYLCGKLFPVPLKQFSSNVVWHVLEAGTPVTVTGKEGEYRVEPFATCHPGGSLAFKVFADDAVFFYSGDHEIINDGNAQERTVAMLQGADLAVVDAMYGEADYQPGWGHTKWEDWVTCAQKAKLGCLVLSHHEPCRTDGELDTLQRMLATLETDDGPRFFVARESMRFHPPHAPSFTAQSSDWLSTFLDGLARYREENTILDRILAKSREITGADAGTVFVAEGNELVFAYTHNDTLFSEDRAYKFAYSTVRLPISMTSIAGYAAVTGKVLNLPDVRKLPDDVPFTFNDSLDNTTGYRTQSMLCVPFFRLNGEVAGVLQLINSVDPHSGKVGPFSYGIERYVKMLAREARNILERGALLRQHIYRLLHMASTHDPSETGPHAERVGAIAAELYQVWANRNNLSPDIIRYEKSCIRLAAMLHDIGKVGVSDLILKKPAGLSNDEFTIMREHTQLGAAILHPEGEDIADMAYLIALHHHQKWDGTGYSGGGTGGKLSGENIPLPARITAVADVFDALVSPRCYKPAWPMEEAMALIRKEAGTHFDPFLVQCMEEVYEILPQIYARFPDE